MGASIVAEKPDGNACITNNVSVVFAVANNYNLESSINLGLQIVFLCMTCHSGHGGRTLPRLQRDIAAVVCLKAAIHCSASNHSNTHSVHMQETSNTLC